MHTCVLIPGRHHLLVIFVNSSLKKEVIWRDTWESTWVFNLTNVINVITLQPRPVPWKDIKQQYTHDFFMLSSNSSWILMQVSALIKIQERLDNASEFAWHTERNWIQVITDIQTLKLNFKLTFVITYFNTIYDICPFPYFFCNPV